jgi:hypothetical protein
MYPNMKTPIKEEEEEENEEMMNSNLKKNKELEMPA